MGFITAQLVSSALLTPVLTTVGKKAFQEKGYISEQEELEDPRGANKPGTAPLLRADTVL